MIGIIAAPPLCESYDCMVVEVADRRYDNV